MSRDEYRKNAVKCRDLVDKTKDLEIKAQWIRLADEWTRMAEAAHSRPAAFDAK